MNNDEYGHDFEDGERNGWENDTGSPDGILITESTSEGSNTFWSGKLEYVPGTFRPSLAKMFTLSGGETEEGYLLTTLRYRVQPPEPGEATDVGVVVTSNISAGAGYTFFWIDPSTPTGKWIQINPISVYYSGTRAHIVIGAHYALPKVSGVSRKVDIDDIKVVRVPLPQGFGSPNIKSK